MSDSKVLLDLQDCDTQIMRSKRELDELPELKAIMDCRAKRKEIKGKQDQVVELLDEVEGKLAKLQAEEERVIAKIKALQEKLDTNAITVPPHPSHAIWRVRSSGRRTSPSNKTSCSSAR